jgi:hypothetical protein
VRAGGKTAIAFADVVAAFAKRQFGRDRLNGRLDAADIMFRLSLAPFLQV